jgi:hypothetical protein
VTGVAQAPPVAPRGAGLDFASLERMETFNDLDFIFLLIDVLVLAAGVFAVGAWYVDHRRHALRERA